MRTPVFVFFSLFLFWNGDEIRAQTAHEKPYGSKWEASTDLLWLFGKNQYPASLFVRRNYEKRALRMRLGMYGSRYKDLTGQSLNNPLYITKLSPYLAVGYEWQFPKEKSRVVPYLALDIPFSLQYDMSRNDVFTSGTVPYIINRLYDVKITTGISGIAGLKYYISKNWSVSAETNLNLRLIFSDSYGTSNGSSKQTALNYRRLDGELVPLQVINATYHF
ncbi:MAG: hypothetical protein U0Y10_13285 [Spirosomataceae bacterium]